MLINFAIRIDTGIIQRDMGNKHVEFKTMATVHKKLANKFLVMRSMFSRKPNVIDLRMWRLYCIRNHGHSNYKELGAYRKAIRIAARP